MIGLTKSRSDSPIILFGAPRSGTTYLENILNSHPEVFISNERRIFSWLHNAAGRLTEDDLNLLADKEAFIEYLNLKLPQLISDFYRDLAPEAVYWGDKNPFYGAEECEGCLQTILRSFPNAKFIGIVRDGRDVVTSLVRKKNADGSPWAEFEQAHDIWLGNIRVTREFADSAPPRSFLCIKYEDLVAGDVRYAEQIFRFLGIDFHDSVREFCQRQSIERTPFSEPVRDLSKGAARSEWSSYFKPGERKRSLAMLEETLEELGYDLPGRTYDDSAFIKVPSWMNSALTEA